MLYPFINAYLTITGQSKTHVFAKIAPFSLKSDNFSKVYIIEPSFSDKVLSHYHLYKSSTLAKFIQDVGGTETKEVLFVTDRDVNESNTLKCDFDRDARNIAGLLSENIICKYYFRNGVFLYNRGTKLFESPKNVAGIVSRYENSLQIIDILKQELSKPNNSSLRILENVI